eukprot:3615036-Amphidinium_carterae.1
MNSCTSLTTCTTCSSPHMTARSGPAAPNPEGVTRVPDVNTVSKRYSAALQRAHEMKPMEQRANDCQLITLAKVSLHPQPTLDEEVNHFSLRHSEQCWKIDLTKHPKHRPEEERHYGSSCICR